MKTVGLGVRLFLFYTLLFLIGRLSFFLLNIQDSGFDIALLANASVHGLPMDFSMAGYVTLLNVLIVTVCNVFKFRGLSRVLLLTNHFLIVVMGSFLVINGRLYSYWGYHIDRSILEYLKTPKEAFASANFFDWGIVLLMVAVFIYLMIRCYRYLLTNFLSNYEVNRSASAWALLLAGILIVPIRGGLDVATMNVSTVYYSSEPYANHLAVNPVWNAAFSLTESEVTTFNFTDSQTVNLGYRSAYPVSKDTSHVEFNKDCNVVFIVLESFTANVVSSIGGIDGITPNLNKWMHTGLSFEQCYASGDRSDKGLTTLFTGFPALPNARLLSHPNKLSKVPKLYEGFKNAGYNTSFYYGGNLDFANLKLLFSDGSVDDVVTGSDVSTSNKGKWGVRDEDMFNQFYNDIQRLEQPFFSTLYTLSSHEPFDIPEVSYTSDSLTSDFYKAIYYTDSCFGDFMDKLRKSELWENTLVVVTADHGVKNPGNLVLLSPRKYRVPLLLTGGVINQRKRYTHYCSHTDIPLSLQQSVLKTSTDRYDFAKSIFDSTNSNAFYYYVLGAGIINENGCIVYDIKGSVFLVNTTENDSISEIMQKQLLGVTQLASEKFRDF